MPVHRSRSPVKGTRAARQDAARMTLDRHREIGLRELCGFGLSAN